MKTVGILGDGQLAQLLAHSAYSLGLKTLCFGSAQSPAARMSDIFIGELSDAKALAEFSRKVDVITLENENIDLSCFKHMAPCPILPGNLALATAQDRWLEKSMFHRLGIKTVQIWKIDQPDDIKAATGSAILKTRTLGYDGKGQVRITSVKDQADEAFQAIGQQPAILESILDFDIEVSQIAARNRKGDIVFYPLIENQHQDGILRVSRPIDGPTHIKQQAQEYTQKVMESLNYIGILAFEFFVKDDELFGNEIAPRVHNSGHLTIEAFNASQFENHLRAIAGLPLVEPELLRSVQMHNIIGQWPESSVLESAFRIYDYGKLPREKRKLGHLICL